MHVARKVWYKIRGTIRAPFGLLRRYALAILAFILAFAFLFWYIGLL